MKKFYFILALILLHSGIMYCQVPVVAKYIFNNFTVAESLPHNFIDDLYKDSRGFIWISTGGGGLVRYDGYEFLTLNVSSFPVSLKSNYIRQVSEDNFSRLWVISSRGVDVINLRTMQNITNNPDNPDNLQMEKLSGINAQSVMKDQNGSIWILSVEKIYKVDFDKNGNIDNILSSEKKIGEKAVEDLSSESEAVQRMMVESVCFRLWEESFWIKVENRCHLEQKVWKSLPPSVAKICFRN